MNRAARSAPRAYVSRLWALCTSSSRSPSVPNDTVCSPTTSPERRERMPISCFARSPGSPCRPYTATWSRSRPSAAATTSAMRSAVPLGASFLKRWWVSVISMSYSSPSAFAMVARSLNATFVATDMLGERRIAARRASSVTSARWAAVKPVVPITARAPACATSRRCSSEASGTENSMSTRSRVITALASPPTATPTFPTPASSPASPPSEAWPGASSAATRRRSGVSARQAMTRFPMRPAAPATMTSVVGAPPRPRLGEVSPSAALMMRLLDEGVRLEDRAQLLAIGVAHAAHGQPELRLEHAGHRHGLFDRDGIGLEERRPRQREEPVVQISGSLPVAVERRVHQVGCLSRHDVRDHRDDAAAADRQQRQRDVVVTREHGEVGTACRDHLAHLVERPGRFLHPRDARDVADEAGEGVGLDVHRRAALDVVDEDRDGDRLGHGPEVPVEALLGRLVVVRVDDERAGGARPLGVLRQVDRLGGRVGAGARDDPDPAARSLDDDLHDPPVLVVRQARGLAGGSARNQAVGPVRDVELDQLPEFRLVDLAVSEGGDHRNE